MSDKYREILWHNDFEQYGKAYFEQHNDSIRKLVPAERLLEFEAKYVSVSKYLVYMNSCSGQARLGTTLCVPFQENP